jgi:hypothetical protein
MEPDQDISPPEVPTSEQLAEMALLRQEAESLIERMDTLLAEGAAAAARLDEHYAEHGITPGIGERMLTGKTALPEDRYIHSRLLHAYENIEETIRNFGKKGASSAVPAAGPRAVASRYRI